MKKANKVDSELGWDLEYEQLQYIQEKLRYLDDYVSLEQIENVVKVLISEGYMSLLGD